MGQYVMTFVDQAGVIRSVYVEQARDRDDAVEKGRELLTRALKQHVPKPYTDKLSLTLMGIESGGLTVDGWVPEPRKEER